MKVRVTLVIMSLLSTLSRSSKLLKVPRVYNAFVTSDDDLQSSQTYPILTPVVQSFRFSVPRSYVSTNVYRSFGSPSQFQYGDAHSYSYTVQNTVKEDQYQYNVVETGLPFQFELPTVTTAMIAEKSPAEQVILFSPTNSFTIRNGNSAKVGGNRYLFLETSPVEQDDDDLPDPRPVESKVNDDVRLQRAHQRFRGSPRPKNAYGVNRSPLPDDDPYNKPSSIKAKKPKTDSSSNDYVDENEDDENDDLVKNNRPKDTTIVDVPPPPIPTRWKTNKKSPGSRRTEEYPPPAVGSI